MQSWRRKWYNRTMDANLIANAYMYLALGASFAHAALHIAVRFARR